jgi:hypothetical protein
MLLFVREANSNKRKRSNDSATGYLAEMTSVSVKMKKTAKVSFLWNK